MITDHKEASFGALFSAARASIIAGDDMLTPLGAYYAAGYDPDAKDAFGLGLVHYATIFNNTHALDLMHKRGDVDTKLPASKSSTPLVAVLDSDIDVFTKLERVAYLLDCGCEW